MNIVLELGGWSTILAYVRDAASAWASSAKPGCAGDEGLGDSALLDSEASPAGRVEADLPGALPGSIDAPDLSSTGDVRGATN